MTVSRFGSDAPLAMKCERACIPLVLLLALVISALAWPSVACAAGRITDFAFDSPALGKAQSARIYRPGGVAPAGGWPVLYLLHGLDGTAYDWEEAGGIGGTLDRMIGAGDIRPMLVVMPDAANSWYVDSADVGGPGDYAAMILTDLPKAIERAFPVGRDSAHRAIAGLSMGGFGALRLALTVPERFGAVAALSPAMWQNVPEDEFGKSAADLALVRDSAYFHRFDPATIGIGIDIPPEGVHFGGAFGLPFQPLRFNAANVFTLLERASRNDAALPPIFLTVGDDDSHLLWRGAIAFFETMRADRRPIEFRMTDGDHSWDLWKVSIEDALRFIDSQIDQPKSTGLPGPTPPKGATLSVPAEIAGR